MSVQFHRRAGGLVFNKESRVCYSPYTRTTSALTHVLYLMCLKLLPRLFDTAAL